MSSLLYNLFTMQCPVDPVVGEVYGQQGKNLNQMKKMKFSAHFWHLSFLYIHISENKQKCLKIYAFFNLIMY